jgi:5-methylcytosine-specific restriction endonuclease McrA
MRDGLEGVCKVCVLLDQGRYRERNLEACRARSRAYAEANKAAALERFRKWWAFNKEVHNARTRDWTRRNPLANAAKSRRYKARKREAGGDHTPDEVWLMYEDQGGLCAYCEAPLLGTFEVDHMIPLSRGGANDWSNLAVTCVSCNRRKHANTAEEFMERIM